MSLSSSINVYSVLFWSRIAARHLAPSIPNEFLRMEPSSIPKLIDLMYEFLINSSRMRERPTSLIMLLARLRCSILVLLIRFLIACMPYSLIELSAKFSYVKLG